MTKKIVSSLVLYLTILYTASLMAERPAAYDEDTSPAETTEIDTSSIDDGRPATSDTSDSVEVIQETGDVLGMPATEQQAGKIVSVQTLDFPRRGMTQDKVQNELGRPVEIIPPVGQPPITRWVYDDRIVYFEYSSVIHVVAK